ncbi:MAG: sulfite exporter TauE/SafE family protein [Verrucomicrobiia bacterium]
MNYLAIIAAGFGVLWIGIAKAGFGGGLGMLTTPICVLAFGMLGKPPSFAIGMLLPLLCSGDAFSLYHYWKKWKIENLYFLLPGVIIGVFIGAYLVGKFSPRQLNICIGIIAVAFVLFQLIKEKIFKLEREFKPSHKTGFPCGIFAGLTSTFAHGAGPVVSIFLIPQKMPKEIFVGTTVLIFTFINWIKMPFFIFNGIITKESLLTGLCYFPLVPLGVWIGVWLNKKIPEKLFINLVYFFVFLTGLYLIFFK